MIENFFTMVIGLVIVFAIIIGMLLKHVKKLYGKTTVKIGVEAIGVKTYMEVSMEENAVKNLHKENEQDSFPKLPTP